MSGIGRVAVDHHDRRAQEQRRDERVPHHPGGRREPLEPVAGLDVPAQTVVLELLDEDPAVAVDDRLRQTRRPGGEEDVERVCERQRVELERPGLGEELVPGDRVRQGIVVAARVGDVDDRRQARQAVADRGDLLAAVDELVAVAVAGDGQQHLRLELAEPVEHAAHAELRRARRPDRAEAGAREEGDERLRDVRQVGDDPVARPDAEPLQAGAGAGHLLAQLAERDLERRRATASARRPRRRPRPRPGRPCARRSSAARPGTTPRPASRASRARARTARARGSRRSPRSTTRSPRGR